MELERANEREPGAIRTPLAPPSLPKGGGAIRSIGEKLAANPVTGTATLTVPIPAPPGRSSSDPKLALTYDSGAGNGPLGMGWTLSVPAITRKTDKGLPRYLDADESDVFILAGAEDLVPILDGNGRRVETPRIVHGTSYRIRYYRPRVEGLFARIERWTTSSGLSHFRTITRDNITTLYGFDPDSRIVSPDDPTRVFSYLACRVFDDKGSASRFEYIADDAAGVDHNTAHETNRTDAIRGTQRYLKHVYYGNTKPYFASWTEQGEEPPFPEDWHFHIVFDYGDHNADAPTPTRDVVWPMRPDPFSVHRAGFEVRTHRRCQRTLVFHSFQNEDVGVDCLVQSLDLVYSDQLAPSDPRNPIYTLLASVTRCGYRKQQAGYLRRTMPAVEFDYSVPQIQPDVFELDAESARNLPEGLDSSQYHWVDLDGEGLSGVLSDANGSWMFKRNLSARNQVAKADGTVETRAELGPLVMLPKMPARGELGGHQRLLDLGGDGRLDVVALDAPAAGFFERTEHRAWHPLRTFASLPQLPWGEPNVGFVDVTGDGLADVLLTEGGVFTFWPSLGKDGFGDAIRVTTTYSEERGPAIVRADGTETVFGADMTGDGLTDFVRIRNGEVCYWPNQGYGRFGPKVTMDQSPRFVDEPDFDPKRLRLADIDGSGTTDLVYVGADGVYVCFNRSGNSWAEPQKLAIFPAADEVSSVQVFDLLGNGTSCIVWMSPLASFARSPVRYVDVMGGQKPHLMIQSRNNLGAETRLTYAPSTKFYLLDELAGKPWVTRLPHVVHVVERSETVDYVGRSRLITRYAYHHGYYDGHEREFRGFGMVEQWDTDEHRYDTAFPEVDDTNWDDTSWSPPVLTRTWFHTGAFLEARSVSRQYAHEYWVEPALRPDARAADRAAMQLPDSTIVDASSLSAFDLQEAYRALKGMPLRVEVYAEDNSKLADNPYSVVETNYTVECRQPIGANQHAVMYAHARETLQLHYERNPDDPRVSHEVTLEADAFGDLRRQVTIGYPRRSGYPEPEPTLSAAFRGMLAYDQTRLHVVATEHRFTNDLADPAKAPDTHRTPMPSEHVSAEWTGIAPKQKGTGITQLFSFDELDTWWTTLWDGTHDIPYEQVPSADVDGAGTPASTPTRRIVEHARTLYRKDDLTALLAQDQLESLALAGESYQLAFTPGLVAGVFGARVVDADVADDGGYVHLGDTSWWAPSGRTLYSSVDGDAPANELQEARAHFFVPRRAVDPFGAITRASYVYDLLPATSIDALNNTTTIANDYRVLQPATITDPNGNRSQVHFDALGLVVGSAVMGKVAETLGDTFSIFVDDLDDATIAAHLANPLADPGGALGTATTRMIYDLHAYERTRAQPQPDPPVIYRIARETHVSDLGGGTTVFQHELTYSDGLGREIQKKVLAEPGPLVDNGPDVTRWVGSGWTIFDNKGKPVRRYEPFFSATPQFEFASTVGVSSVLLYDSADRVVATLHPDNTWEKTIFDPWHQETWDVNDTILISDPRKDLDIGDRFRRLLGANAWVSWHDQRFGGALGAAAKIAAANTEAHAATPAVSHYDSLGRTCLTISDNASQGRYPSRTARDVQGKALAVFDALGRRAVEYCVRGSANGYVAGYDLVGNGLYRNSMDAGARWTLHDLSSRPIRGWDALRQAFLSRYDALRRPTHRFVTANASTILLERSIYGEGMASANLCGRMFRLYDQSGLASNDSYDYKGNLLASTRQLTLEYRKSIDWTPLANLTDSAALDAAAQPQLDSKDIFTASTVYDALDRPIQVVTPHSATMKPNVIRASFNGANLLERIDVWRQQPNAPTSLLPLASADLNAVKNVDYNARSQRMFVAYGSGATTTYGYDPLTFRLTSLTTTRGLSYPQDQQVVQDLAYTYDPIGNTTHIEDDADTQNVIYFRNKRVEPSSDYTYDAIYRLATATGREHLGQTNGNLDSPNQITDDDSFRMKLLQPGDGTAMGTYTETYAYDPVGNLLTLAHQVSSGSWTRHYTYTEPSQITTAETNNRLSTTSLPKDPDQGPYSATYIHDANGNMTRMPHLPVMTWDEDDRLRSTSQQVVNAGTPQLTFYRYDTTGTRKRKVTDGQAREGHGVRAQQRIYIGAVEILREYSGDGTTVLVERETLHIHDGPERIALVETRTIGTDDGLPKLVRYQHGNHLGSAVLELDDAGDIISYEEYFPYGCTSYQSVRNQNETPKRYRYIGKERDDENALGYHGARYYAPWLGRWASADPAGMVDGPNVYAYTADNPIRFVDASGTDLSLPHHQKKQPQTTTYTFSDEEARDTVVERRPTAGEREARRLAREKVALAEFDRVRAQPKGIDYIAKGVFFVAGFGLGVATGLAGGLSLLGATGTTLAGVGGGYGAEKLADATIPKNIDPNTRELAVGFIGFAGSAATGYGGGKLAGRYAPNAPLVEPEPPVTPSSAGSTPPAPPPVDEPAPPAPDPGEPANNPPPADEPPNPAANAASSTQAGPKAVDLRALTDEAHALLGKGTRYKSTSIGQYEDGSLGISSSDPKVPRVQADWAKARGIRVVNGEGHAEPTLKAGATPESGPLKSYEVSSPFGKTPQTPNGAVCGKCVPKMEGVHTTSPKSTKFSRKDR